MNSNLGKQKFFLIYQISNLITGKIYVGAHVTYNINDKYFGSSKYLKKDVKELGKNNFRKEILHIFDNKEDMMNKEAEIVNKEFCHRIDTYNKHIGGIMDFTWTNMIITKDKEGNIHSIYNDDPRYLSGELFGIAKGNKYALNKVAVKDKNDNYFQVDKSDPRYLSGELVHFSLGNPGNCSWLNRKHSEETKEKMSKKAQEKIGDKNSMFGKIRTEEFKNKVKDKLAKDFFVYDKDGIFISKEKNINEYAKNNNLNTSSICKVLNGKNTHTKGFKFFYEMQ